MIEWRLHLSSLPERVYAYLATDEGRAAFWAESAVEREGVIDFVFPDGTRWSGDVIAADPPERFSVVYYGGNGGGVHADVRRRRGLRPRSHGHRRRRGNAGRLGVGAARAEGRGRLQRGSAQPRSTAD